MHMYKNKGGVDECASCRPICSAQIIYKIRSQLITWEISKILNILTNLQQFGYKSQLPTIDSIAKLEAYIRQSTPDAQLILMRLAEEFGKVNITIPCATLYKKKGYQLTRSRILEKDIGTLPYNENAKGDMEQKQKITSVYSNDQQLVRFY